MDSQINHEAGKALVVLVAAERTWSCFRNIAKRDHGQVQPTIARLCLGCLGCLGTSDNPFPMVWPGF